MELTGRALEQSLEISTGQVSVPLVITGGYEDAGGFEPIAEDGDGEEIEENLEAE
jgi:hypothetical protein